MKRLIVFVLALLAIGFVESRAQVVITELDNGSIRISSNEDVIQMSQEEYIAFTYFVANLLEVERYFDKNSMRLKKTLTFPDMSKFKFYDANVTFEYNSMFGFAVGDSNYLYAIPEDMNTAIDKFTEKK